MNEIKHSWTDEEILDFAKDEVLIDLINTGYPKFPTDEFGNPDYSDGAGCVPWVICHDATVKVAEIHTKKEDLIIVVVEADITWSHSDWDEMQEDNDAQLAIYIDITGEKLEYESIERVD